MKHFLRILLAAVLAVAVCASVVAQTTITTNGTGGGVWSSTSTWAGGVVPTSDTDTIKYLAGDSVLIDIPVTITKTLVKLSTRRDSVGASGSLTIGNGGTYWHAVGGGYIPAATWGTGSTCLVTGVTTPMPSGIGQNYYNLTYNCPGHTGNMHLNLGGMTISGTLTVLSTNFSGGPTGTPSNYLRLMGGSVLNQTCNLNNVVVSNFSSYLGVFSSGSSTPTVNVAGNITISGGAKLAISSNSTSITTYNVSGNITCPDSGYITKNNTANASKMIFLKGGPQTWRGPLSTVAGTSYQVNSGTTLDLDTNKISGSGSFILSAGATLVCPHPGGVSGNITITGVNGGGNSLSKNANFTFNGSVAQVTGALMPDSVNNVTINNAAGVTSSQTLRIKGTLYLVSGVLSGDYSAANTVTDVPKDGAGIPQEFAVGQNYPNPFNPSTTIPFAIDKAGFVTLRVFDLLGREVSTLVSQQMTPGRYTATWTSNGKASGLYFYTLQSGDRVETRRMVLLK